MKIFCLTITIAVILLICLKGLQAQTTQARLNQVELIKQMAGSWERNITKDTTVLWDARSYGIGLECNYKSMTKGEIVTEGKELYGYNKSIDKFINAVLIKGKDIAIYAFEFTSKNTYVMVPYSNISGSERATFKVEGEFKSPDTIAETITLNNKRIRIDIWTRVK